MNYISQLPLTMCEGVVLTLVPERDHDLLLLWTDMESLESNL